MKKIFFGLFFTTIVVCFAGKTADPQPTPSADGFDMLKSLEGKWFGILKRDNGSEDPFNLTYSISSNGSAILEESNTGGIEMLTIFNLHNDAILLTHYCGLRNRPVSVLDSSDDGVFKFTTDAELSGLSLDNEMFVTSWVIDVIPEDPKKIYYEYTVSGPDGVAFVAKCDLTRAN